VSGFIESPVSEATDEDLLAQIRDREISALDGLYERYKSLAYALALRIVKNREAAEEVLQDAFLAVWRQGVTYQPGVGRVRPWLLSIVHHRAIDYVRSAAGKRRTTSLDEAWMMPAKDDTFRSVSGSLEREQITRALEDLPPEQRQALELAYFQGYSFVEIAEITDSPVGTVKSRSRLALAKLRQLLSKESFS
jgi:RNA polymerase sigma-70 factor (ECF subfamily)